MQAIPARALGTPNFPLKSRAVATVDAAELAMKRCPGVELSIQEQQILAGYSGMGPLAGLFDDGRGNFIDPDIAAEGGRLKAALSANEYDRMRPTILTSYYTPEAIAAQMISVLVSAGLGEGARVLEPGCGTGRFLDLAPGIWRMTGIERDPVAAKIAKLKHPDATILERDMRDTAVEGQFEAVIGNVPFGETRYELAGRALPVADYFIARSIGALVPGGIAVLMTSNGFLDKADSDTREWIAAQAELIDAARLPSSVFAQDGAGVITDILVFKKKAVEQADTRLWCASEGHPALEGLRVSKHFQSAPERVLGALASRSGPFGARLEVTDPAEGLTTALTAWANSVSVVAPEVASGAAPVVADPDAIEGQLSVDGEGFVVEVQNGHKVRAKWRNKELSKHDRSKGGPRTVALIELAEQRERIVRAQIDQAGNEQIEALRKRGVSMWRRFTLRFGPINETIHKETKAGDRVRYPQLEGPFAKDPRVALVAGMEDYDEDTNTAKPGAILTRNVVTVCPEPEHADTAVEALMISMSRRGKVDPAFMSGLCNKAIPEVMGELGEFVFRDPKSGDFVVRDEYLSGQVREKLETAREAANSNSDFVRNVEALEAVQPTPLSEHEIDLSLGSPIVEAAELETFLKSLLKAEKGIEVAKIGEDTWKVSAWHDVVRSVQATAEFGTGRVNAIDLVEALLNQRVVKVTDETEDDQGNIRRVINQDETLAAKEKADAIQAAFKAWIFEDCRKAEFVDRYNSIYNCRRAREYVGDHLDFPGLELGSELRPHQRNAVWRALASTSNNLWAHFTGAGKTLAAAALVMKARQLGIAKRPVFTCPNHLPLQIASEFARFFPSMKVLVAEPEDVQDKGLARFLAKVVSSDADVIIMGHSTFERIGVSRETEQRFIRDEIAELRVALADLAAEEGRTVTRRAKRLIESRVEKAEAKLKDIKKRKERAVTFEQLGIDLLLVDEAHFFKNLPYVTKASGVSGLNPNGSKRASDMLMKVRIVNAQSAMRGAVVFATATPLANSIAELWTFARYLVPEILQEARISCFDSFAAAFCEIVTSLEISPDGTGLQPVTRLSRFKNLPELLSIWTTFADVVRADMVDIELPELAGGKPEKRLVDMSGEGELMQRALVARYERIKGGGVDPKDDNALAVTTDGRLLSIDPRLLDAGAGPGNLLPELAGEIAQIYRDSAKTKGVQLVFLSMGINPSPRSGFSAYDELIGLLKAEGIPASEIVNSRDDVKTKAAEARVHAGLRSGKYRVFIVSDAKGGTGLNVADRLAALHDVCLPWRPCDLEQRHGRIVRQCKTAKLWPRRILTWVCKASFASRILQLLEVKAAMIEAIMRADIDVRTLDDIGDMALSYGEMKALSTGEPAIMLEAELAAELRRLNTLETMYHNAQRRMGRQIESLESYVKSGLEKIDGLKADLQTRNAGCRDALLIGKHAYEIGEASKAMKASLESVRAGGGGVIAEYAGFEVRIDWSRWDEGWLVSLGTLSPMTFGLGRMAPGTVVARIVGMVEGLDTDLTAAEKRVVRDRQAIKDATEQRGKPFEHGGLIDEIASLQKEVQTQLSIEKEKRDRAVLDTASERFDAIKAQDAVKAKSTARTSETAKSVVAEILGTAAKAAEAFPAPEPVEVEAPTVVPAVPVKAERKPIAATGRDAKVISLKPRRTRKKRPSGAEQLSMFEMLDI